MSKTQEIENLLSPIAQHEGFEIVDIQYVKESGDWILRVFIDKESAISMNDCEKMSRSFEEILDNSDIIKDSYVLEVSSPGIDRVLKKEKDFKKFIGSKIKVKTNEAINNQKNFLGILLNCENGKIKIDDVTKGKVEIEILDIKKANLEVDF